MRKHVFLILVGVLLLSNKSFAQFTDSLQFILHHQQVIEDGGTNYLQFDISVLRPNINWNDGVFDMGDADFYLSFNEAAFDKGVDPELIGQNEKIDPDGVTGTNRLSAKARVWWASSKKRLTLKVTARKDGIGDKLTIPLRDTLFIAQIRWKVAPGNKDPKIEWDETASGMITLNNNPIIPTFVGSIDKYPNPSITIDEQSEQTLWACEGTDVMLFVNARSTGNDIRYKWQYSNGGDWQDMEATAGMHSAPDPAGFDYLVHGSGDTVVLRHAPGILDNMNFQCVISDPTLSAATTTNTALITLKLRDSLKVFLSQANDIPEEGASEVKICPTGDGGTVRLNILGPDYSEYQEMFDVYVEYFFADEDGGLTKYCDTIKRITEFNQNGSSEGVIYWKQLNVPQPGTYYVTKASTSHCYDLPKGTPAYELDGIRLDTMLSNAMAYAKYDTLLVKYSTSPDTTVLPRIAMAMEADTNLLVGLSGPFSQVYNLYDGTKKLPELGYVQFRPSPDNDTVYHSKAAGIDTVLYVKDVNGCPEVSMREVEVIDNYYLTMKLFLEGAVLSSDLMTCVDGDILPEEGINKQSPYDDKLTFPLGKFPLGGSNNHSLILPEKELCDWIYIKLRDGLNGEFVDSTSALLREDGIVCGLDGKPGISFKNIDKKPYHVYVGHRNHIAIISTNAISLSTTRPSDDNIILDLTKPNNVYESALKLVAGTYCMYAGDLDGDSFVTVSDVKYIIVDNGAIQYLYDVNHDAFVSAQDQKVVTENNGNASFVP